MNDTTKHYLCMAAIVCMVLGFLTVVGIFIMFYLKLSVWIGIRAIVIALCAVGLLLKILMDD